MGFNERRSAHRWGRKETFLLTLAVSLVGGIGAAFPVTYEGYIAWRGVVGMTYPAIFQTPFIMSMEIMSPEKRTFDCMFAYAVYGVALRSAALLEQRTIHMVIHMVLVVVDIAWPTVALCSLEKMSITASFATIYVYGAELLPTVLRTFAMGIAAIVASVSLIVTPHILYLDSKPDAPSG
ncbi:hypothetical protein HPB51_009040 [Rhipicephalus microplus]|uniref:Uncharacterized protein n=1 Tax=Rhipicephalus microplus TaxID=6941 RepID=A0A9J6D9I2_RHIMP|nr:hypothetical protein HPB51_009040 [Rhipicephalus microplus]